MEVLALEPRDYVTVPIMITFILVSIALFGGVILVFWLWERIR